MRFENRLVDFKDLGECLDVVWRSLSLAVEEGCDGDFVAAEGCGDGFEGEVFALFGGEEEGGLGGEAGEDVLLWTYVLSVLRML